MADPFPFGARVRIPFNQVGLIVDQGPSRGTRVVSWVNAFTGRAVEGIMPIGALTLLALPLPTTPKG